MALEPVHVLELDRATSRLELRRINPTRGHMEMPMGPDGKPCGSSALYTWQNGKYHGVDGQEMDENFVPAMFREQIEKNPVRVTTEGPAVTASCKFCGQKMNSSEMEAHLVEHVHETMKAAGGYEKSASAKNTHYKTEKA